MRPVLALALVMIGGCSGSAAPRLVVPKPPQAAASIATVRPVLSSEAPRGDPTPPAAEPEAAVAEPHASEPTLPDEAVALAKAKPGMAFACRGALYIATRSGEAKLLAYGAYPNFGQAYDDVKVSRMLSPDGRWVAFVRRTPETALWLASTEDGSERLLLSEQEDERAWRNLTGFDAPSFSTDGGTIFFLAEAWPNAAALTPLTCARSRNGSSRASTDFSLFRAGRTQVRSSCTSTATSVFRAGFLAPTSGVELSTRAVVPFARYRRTSRCARATSLKIKTESKRRSG
jgi:hypothetical protein